MGAAESAPRRPCRRRASSMPSRRITPRRRMAPPRRSAPAVAARARQRRPGRRRGRRRRSCAPGAVEARRRSRAPGTVAGVSVARASRRRCGIGPVGVPPAGAAPSPARNAPAPRRSPGRRCAGPCRRAPPPSPRHWAVSWKSAPALVPCCDDLGVGRGNPSDEQWALLEPLPPVAGLGRPSRGRRRLTDGVRWRVRTGAPWRDLPSEYGRGKRSTGSSAAGSVTAPGQCC